jgi:hypothetical protein
LALNQITDISVLSGLLNLDTVMLANNCISDFTPVNHVPNVNGVDNQEPDSDGDGIGDACDPDIDGDGIFNKVDTDVLTVSSDFYDGTTYGTITSLGDQILTVRDSTEPAPNDGVVITADPSGGTLPATVTACQYTADTKIEQLNANDKVIVTCSSSTVKVNIGTVEITFTAYDDTTTNVSLSAGNSLTFDPAAVTFTAPISNIDDTVTVYIGGEALAIQRGETVPADGDGDGYYFNVDCDDNNASVNPGASETCNGIDDNCINGADEGFNVGEVCFSSPNSCGDNNAGNFVCTADGSGTECNAVQPDERSGYGDSCESAPNNCGDTNTGVNVCADVGVECNAVTPDDRPLITAYIDSDSDGFGDINSPVDATCGMPAGAVNDSSDCNDNDETVNPDASEICDDGIDNNCDGEISVTPFIGTITAIPAHPIAIGESIAVTVEFTDPNTNDTHTVTCDWGDDSTSETYPEQGLRSIQDTHTYTQPGVYAITATVTEDYCGGNSNQYQYIVVYDPDGGFVTGGGWIMSPEGAYTDNPSLTGKANFGFVSKYKKGATVPTGETEFQFSVADLNFHSDSYEWLVIAGAKAQYKGVGTINGMGAYKFILYAIDADINDIDSHTVDLFRIKIWTEDESGIETVIYDNAVESDEDTAMTAISGGSIVIHKGKGKK